MAVVRNTGKHSGTSAKEQMKLLLASQAFQTGFAHVKGGIPYLYDPVPYAPAVAAYERGRQFAHVYSGPLLNEKGEPAAQALINLRKAARLKEVV